jgi:hypothetical protein
MFVVAGHPYRMRLFQTLAFTLLLAPCALAAPQNSPGSSSAFLPPVTAYALDRAKVTLPADFASPLHLLILSFQRDQQTVVDGWLSAVSPGAAPQVQIWLLPVSPRENGLYRWWLNASLRSSLPASQPRHYTVPLYVNKGQFLRSLQVTSEREVVLLLTDKAGHVLWRTTGPVTDGKKAEFTSFLKSVAR